MFSSLLEPVRKSSAQIWDFLTEPSSSISDPQIRQQSRLLASMLLGAMFAIFFLIILSTQTSNGLSGSGIWLVVSVGLMVLVWAAYFLTRRGHYRSAVNALLTLSSAFILVPAVAIGGRGSYNSLFYLFTVTVFAYTFLHIRTAVITAAIHLIVIFLFRDRFPGVSAEAIISGPFSFNLFLSIFMLLVGYHQQRSTLERQKELAESEGRYRIVNELISDYAYSLRVTAHGDVLHEWITEDSFQRVTGYRHEELDIGENVNLTLFLDEDKPELEAELQQTLANKTTTAQHRIQTKSGEIRWLQISRLPEWNAKEGRVTRFYGIAQDITERKRAEKALKESELRYRLLTETIPDFVIQYDVASHKMLYISPSYERALGYTVDEINALDPFQRVHPDDLEVTTAGLMQVVNGKSVVGTQYRSRTKSGDYIWVEAYSNPVMDESGKVQQIIISARDITSRKQTEMALKASEERYRIISELISDYAYFYRFNADGTRTREWITDSVERVTGFSPSELPQQTRGLTDKSYLGDYEAAEKDIERIHQGEQIYREFQTYTKNRDLRWLSVFRRPVWNDDETEVIGYYGVAQDITERKQAALALEASEERYRMLTELTSDYAYFYRFNEDGAQVREWITESVIRVTGYSAEEMPQTPQELAKIFLPDEIAKAVDEIKLLKQGQIVNSETQLYTKDGELRWLSISRRPVWDEKHTHITGYYGVAKDITDRKLAELALRDSEQRYRKISELISDYAFYTRVNEDRTQVREWITDSFTRVTGYTPEEIGASDAAKLFHPDSLSQLEADHRRTLMGEQISNEYRIITKQGAIRWLNLIRQPAWNESHTRVIGYFGVARDITEHKQVENQKMKLMLEQEQFVMVGHLVDALSHDFRTSLATIETSRYLTERLVGDAIRPTVQPKLESIQQSVNHLAAQLEHLHMVSFLAAPSPSPCNLNYLVSSIISEQNQKAIQKHIKLVFKADEGLPILNIDAVKIEKAIRHLIANALTHTPADGNVLVYTRHTDDQAIIEVHDTGIGITSEALERIFEPFFRGDQGRTVDKGGVGLGLTIVKMIIEAHGGTVNVRSDVGKGSIFSLTLPLKEEIAASA
ncbi:MAG: PAS domain S-box protein [Anaerolineaceae bacterium]|nr:PAS domain S-box protein [Anaerolineaceae bacterium]